MPNYSFVCLTCERLFERSMTVAEYDSKNFSCECGSTDVKRSYTGLRVFVQGDYVSNMDALEHQFWHGHKKFIEKNKDKFKSGQWDLAGAPRSREFEPDLKG